MSAGYPAGVSQEAMPSGRDSSAYTAQEIGALRLAHELQARVRRERQTVQSLAAYLEANPRTPNTPRSDSR